MNTTVEFVYVNANTDQIGTVALSSFCAEVATTTHR